MNKNLPYKALILDLDGTTVEHHADDASHRVKQAIAAIKNDIHVCAATGRPLKNARAVLTHLGLSGPCIINNGTEIFDPVKDKIIKRFTLLPETTKQVIEKLRKYNLKIFANHEFGEVPWEENVETDLMGIFIPELTNKQVSLVEDELSNFSSISIHKMVSFNKELIALEVTDPRVSKLHGIAEISSILGITSGELIGVGDAYNDFPLLMACGLKFAMGNAVPELKAIADFVAPSVENDGVAVIIEKFILPLLSTS